MEQLIAWLIIGWLLLSVFVIGATVGKPRQPITPGVAFVAMVANALIGSGVVYLAAH